jgi:hypothetical protein
LAIVAVLVDGTIRAGPASQGPEQVQYLRPSK